MDLWNTSLFSIYYLETIVLLLVVYTFSSPLIFFFLELEVFCSLIIPGIDISSIYAPFPRNTVTHPSIPVFINEQMWNNNFSNTALSVLGKYDIFDNFTRGRYSKVYSNWINDKYLIILKYSDMNSCLFSKNDRDIKAWHLGT